MHITSYVGQLKTHLFSLQDKQSYSDGPIHVSHLVSQDVQDAENKYSPSVYRCDQINYPSRAYSNSTPCGNYSHSFNKSPFEKKNTQKRLRNFFPSPFLVVVAYIYIYRERERYAEY